MAAHNYKADAEILHKAFKGAGTDEDAVIGILGNRNKQELEQIDHEYRGLSQNASSLAKALDSELSGSFKDLAVGLVTSTHEYKRKVLREAIEGLGTRERSLIDVLTQSTNEEIRHIAQDAELYQKVLSDVSGDFKLVLVELFKGERPHGGHITEAEAETLSQAFYKAGEGKIGTDEKKYVDIIAHHSVDVLKQIDTHYNAKHKHGLVKAVQSETSGYFEDTLVALLKNKVEYFCDKLHGAISGLGTDERAVIYTFSVLSKEELKQVGQLYHTKYKETLADAIKGDTSFNFKKLLLALL